VAGDGLSARIDKVGAEPDPDCRPIRIVTVHRYLHHVADLDFDASLLEHLPRGGVPEILAPVDVAAGKAPQAHAEMTRSALDQEHAAGVVIDHCRHSHAHVGEEHEVAT